MRFASRASNSETSRNVSTWCSGSTSTCTGACGLMSLIATNPLPLCTYAPSRAMLQKRQSSRRFGKDPRLRHGRCAHAHELAHRRVDEPRRVVVAVAATGAVDEHRVEAAHLRVPAAQAQLVRQGTQPCAPLPLLL